MKKKVWIAVIIIIIAGLLISVYPISVLKIKTKGAKLKPSKAISPVDITYFLQNDAEWSSDTLGNSSSSMGGYGCLVTVITSAIDYFDYQYTPKEINQLFSDNHVYTDNGLVIWKEINSAVPEVDYQYDRVFSSKTIENLLDMGLLPIVEVKYKGIGIHHWVLIIGSDGEDFLIMDPLNSEKQPMKLSEHGSRAYAYRVIVRK